MINLSLHENIYYKIIIFYVIFLGTLIFYTLLLYDFKNKNKNVSKQIFELALPVYYYII